MWNSKDIVSVMLIKIRLAKNNSSLSCGTAMFVHLRAILIVIHAAMFVHLRAILIVIHAN